MRTFITSIFIAVAAASKDASEEANDYLSHETLDAHVLATETAIGTSDSRSTENKYDLMLKQAAIHIADLAHQDAEMALQVANCIHEEEQALKRLYVCTDALVAGVVANQLHSTIAWSTWNAGRKTCYNEAVEERSAQRAPGMACAYKAVEDVKEDESHALPDFSGYWIVRKQDDTRDRKSLDTVTVDGGYCLEQKPSKEDPNQATLSVFPTGTAVSTDVHDVRLREGEFIEASVIDGEVGAFDTTFMQYGFLPIPDQMVLKHAQDTTSPYDSKKEYRTKIGTCDNRGEEKLWQFALFPEVGAALADELLRKEQDEQKDDKIAELEQLLTKRAAEAITGGSTTYRGHQTHSRSGYECMRWTADDPDDPHTYTPEEYPGKGLGDHNYCRNPKPSAYATIWCYTMDSETRWEFCNPIQINDM